MFSIQLDRPHPLYLAGETVKGTVQWTNHNHDENDIVPKEETRKQVHSSSFYVITFTGKVECEWNSISSTNHHNLQTTCMKKSHYPYYSSSKLFSFQQQAPTRTNVFITAPQHIIRGVTVIEMNVYNNAAQSTPTPTFTRIEKDNIQKENFWIFQIFWWSRQFVQTNNNNDNNKNPICLGQTMVDIDTHIMNNSISYLITPPIHHSDNMRLPSVHSIQLSLGPTTTIHSISLHEPFLEGGFIQVMGHIPYKETTTTTTTTTTVLPSDTSFSFVVPSTAPSSFQGGVNSPSVQQARIRYSVCILPIQTCYPVYEQEIHVLSQIPLYKPCLWCPTWTSCQSSPIMKSRVHPFWSLFTTRMNNNNNNNSNDIVTLQLGLSKRIYTPGDSLELTSQTHVSNQTHHYDLQITLRLIQTIQCIVKDGYIRTQLIHKTYPIGTLQGQRRRFTKILYPYESWEPTKQTNEHSCIFVIPSVPSSTTVSNKMNNCHDEELPVQVSYSVQLHVCTVNEHETLAQVQLPVAICAWLPENIHPYMEGIPWDTNEIWEDCWESSSDHNDVPSVNPLPVLCVLPTNNHLLWDVTIDGRPGIYAPHQRVLTILKHDDSEVNLSDEDEEVTFLPATVPDDESISDPDESYSSYSSDDNNERIQDGK